MNYKSYVQNNLHRFLEELFGLLRFASVSADPKYSSQVLAAAEHLRELLKKAGAENTQLITTGGYPVVYGEKIIDHKLPTILIYGHYDVQPPTPHELWTRPAFDPYVQDDMIYARGATDDKGQLFIHLKVLEMLEHYKNQPVNLKYIFEGEEESGSKNLPDFLEKNKKRLAADLVLVSDTSLISLETPSIDCGLRGISYMEVELTGPSHDLHSGIYGGAVANPLNALCQMMASLKDAEGRITIPHFYDDVIELTDRERAELARTPFSLDKFKKDVGITQEFGESEYTTPERIMIRPTLDINGLWGGHMGDGAKTVLPSKAHAKFSMRLVPNQNSAKISALVAEHLKKITPPGIQIKITTHHGGDPVVLPTESTAYQAAEKAFLRSLGQRPVPTRSGASIPIVPLFEKILGLKTLLLGFGLESDGAHSPNEHFGIKNLCVGIETVAYFLEEYAALNKISDPSPR